jgi:hypothetical protein
MANEKRPLTRVNLFIHPPETLFGLPTFDLVICLLFAAKLSRAFRLVLLRSERQTQSDLTFAARQTLRNGAEQRPGALLDLYGCGIAIVE